MMQISQYTALGAALHARVSSMIDNSVNWIAGNGAAILTGAIIAAVVGAVLFGAKLVGHTLARKYATRNHWRRIIGAVLAKIRIWFIAAVVLELVATYSHAPADIAKTIYFLFVIATTLQAAVFAREMINWALWSIARAAMRAMPRSPARWASSACS